MNRELAQKKATELVEKMTLEEMVEQLRYDAPSIDRLGVPEYNWWNEGLHGSARAGTATMLPQAIGLGATFDKKLLHRIGDLVATEARAKYNEFSSQGDRDIYKGLTIWSPNINLFRDPRWGRGQETYGEDPTLITDLSVEFIKGIQGDGEYYKAAACAKHFAVHSGPEKDRHYFDAKASMKDMWETYLPQFEAAVITAEVESVMGAYNRVNGHPACAQPYLMEEILRGKWGFKGHFVSDCWAIRDFHENHRVTKTSEQSAALALKTGCDLNCGCTYRSLLKAVKSGMVSKDYVKLSAIRLFTCRYMLGLFDENEYDKIPYEIIECAEHMAVSSKAADESIVLLKNSGILPLKKDIKTIGVIGPNADSRSALEGNYHGTSSEYVTVLQGIRETFKDSRILYSEGCDIFEKKPDNLAREYNRITEAVAVAKYSDVIILVLGLNENLEGEEGDTGNQFASGDKIDLQFPEVQRVLMENVYKTAKANGTPVITISMTGSAMDMRSADENSEAVIQAWYPGALGGREVAKILSGEVNPSAKLPVTFYATSEELPAFDDYSMVNRTYRYMENEAFYPFGYGLNYSDISIESASANTNTFGVASESGLTIKVTVKNTSSVCGTEVVQVYVKNNDVNETLHPHLAAFERVEVSANGSAEIEVKVPASAFTTVDNDGVRAVRGNSSTVYVGFGQPDSRTEALTGKKTIAISIS
ncbi:MAG: glycoside hydrolase family 3 C-terminal domain-containing protein [Saccharofermentans sp.]|nr:glycoside hydrolase family 3 C-terminal domain-containing protein [Saccharofermentans sp.]